MQSTTDVTVSDYLLTRLAQVGVKSIFGVPGDFNLHLLDFVEDFNGIEWVGCCNELNAAYAADGYARVTKGLGVVITTFGVGELSAINGIAGAFSERVPVLHVVGVPSTQQQAHKALLHHTMGDGRMDVFSNCAAEVTIAQALLTEADKAAKAIDEIIATAIKTCRPTYLTLPMDLVASMISAMPLKKPLTLEGIRSGILSPLGGQLADAEDAAVRKITELFAKAKHPAILVDACAVRYGVVPLVKDLIDKTGVPFFTTPMAQASIDQSHPQFAGLYVGDITIPFVKQIYDQVDCLIAVGLLQSDLNSGMFTFRLPKDNTVELHSDSTTVALAEYKGVTFFTILPKLADALAKHARPKFTITKEGLFPLPEAGWETSAKIEQSFFWPAMSKLFFQPGDVLLTETGTSAYGVLDVQLPENTTTLTQILWGSIGWSVGALLGAATAGHEKGRRVVAFTGDGSVQVTVQDISTLLRHGLTPVLFLLNNDGYTIERLLRGPTRVYNDIQPWRWSELLHTFGAKRGQANVHRIATATELVTLLKDPHFASPKTLTFVEVMMEKLDGPRILKLGSEST